MSVPTPPNLPDLETVFNTPPDRLPRNKQTEALHNREVWQQIYLPLLIGVLAVIGVAVLIGLALYYGNTTSIHIWSLVSTIVVVAQVLIGLLPILVLIGGLAFGLGYLLPKLPPYFKVAQDYTAWLAYKTDWAVKYVTGPVTQVKSGIAGLDGFIQGLRKFFGR